MPFAGYADFAECVSDNQDKSNPEAFCAWLHWEITGAWPSEKSLGGKDMDEKKLAREIVAAIKDEEKEETFSLAGPIAIKNDEKRIVTAPVLVPGEPDSDGETVTKEQVETSALEWMEKYKLVDKKHSFNSAAIPVESWLTRKEETFGDIIVPEGTWMLSVKVTDNEMWNGVIAGKYKGFSITAVRRDEAAAMKSADKSKTLLEDLGRDFIVVTVSMVEQPAVWKSKWVAIKSANEKPNLLNRLLSRLNISTKTNNLKNLLEGVEDMDEKELKKVIKEAVAEEVTPLKEKIEALEGKLPEEKKEEKEPEKDDTTETAPKDKTISDKLAAAKSDLLELYESDDKEKDSKIEALKQRIKILEELVGTAVKDGEEDLPEPVKKELETLRKDVKDLKAAKSSVATGQDGDTPPAEKGEKDPFPRDHAGRRIPA